MYRLTHIESGFEWSFATLAEAIEYLETFERQEEFEIRRQTARSIFLFKKTNICAIAPGPIRVDPGARKRTGACMRGGKKLKKVFKNY